MHSLKKQHLLPLAPRTLHLAPCNQASTETQLKKKEKKRNSSEAGVFILDI
jgi:hypothetical protein